MKLRVAMIAAVLLYASSLVPLPDLERGGLALYRTLRADISAPTSTNGNPASCTTCTLTGISCGGTSGYTVGFETNGVTVSSISAAVGGAMSLVLSNTTTLIRNAYWYYLYAGGGDITVGLSGSTTDIRYVIGCYPGVASSGNPEVTNHAENGNPVITSNSASVTTSTDKDWGIGLGISLAGITSGQAGTTLRDNSATVIDLLDSNANWTPAGSQSLGFNNTAGISVIFVGGFKPAAGGTTVAPHLLLLGVSH